MPRLYFSVNSRIGRWVWVVAGFFISLQLHAQHSVQPLLTEIEVESPSQESHYGAQERDRDQLPATTEYLHVLSTGQSLALGVYSSPALSLAQPYDNQCLSSWAGGFNAPLIPLVEEYDQESPCSGLANTLHVMDSAARPIVMGLHASGGFGYAILKKGTSTWKVAMMQVAVTKATVESTPNHSYRPIAITVVHGETDNYSGNAAAYQGYLEEWQHDYETDISGIVGKPIPIPMFVSQMNTGWTGELAIAQYKAHKANPGKIFLIGPKYQYSYIYDKLHLSNVDSKHLGEMFAKVINEVALKGNGWNPLMPKAVHRVGKVITVDYHIPVGSLEIDTVLVARRPNFGFDFVQTGGNDVKIIDVQLIDGAKKVKITLDRVPTGSDERLRYGYTCYRGVVDGLANCGCGTDPLAVGGNIRDMDVQVSKAIGSTGLPLYNWGVTFEEAVVDDMLEHRD